jgi:hypothetical protein
MKIVIISDVHGNLDALEALPETYDELWGLGDLSTTDLSRERFSKSCKRELI